MTNWVEVTLEADNESAEAIADLLGRYGHQGVVIERAGFEFDVWEYEVPPADGYVVRAYFPMDAEAPDKQQQLRDALRYMNMMWPMPEPQFRVVEDVDWSEAWKQHYHPLRLGKRIMIRPQWIEVEPDPEDVVISLDPGMAFGTGTHPSTQLCMVAVEELTEERPGLSVLDLGCGSGILSIAAAKLGAVKVVGLDIDGVAVEVAEQNVAFNGVDDKVLVQRGSLETVVSSARRFDIALVNILARVIIQMLEAGLAQVVRPGGVGVLGGIVQDQVDEVEAALRSSGLEPYRRRESGDWVVIEARRSTG